MSRRYLRVEVGSELDAALAEVKTLLRGTSASGMLDKMILGLALGALKDRLTFQRETSTGLFETTNPRPQRRKKEHNTHD